MRIDIHKVILLQRDAVSHATSFPFLSISQTRFLFLNVSQKFKAMRDPPIRKVIFLYSLRVIKNGKFETNPAITAPKPKVTRKMGKAQQINVDTEVKSDVMLISSLRSFSIFNFMAKNLL